MSITAIIIIAIVVLIVLWVIFTYNGFIRIRTQSEEGFSTMDVYLKKRWDLIPNLVETVKGYAKHEKTALEEITKLRNSTYDKMNNDEKIKTNEHLSNSISRIMAIAESYPDLKASENFINLSKELSNAEDEIANSRKYYNAVVRIFNNKVQMFPSNLIARLIGYTPKAMFEASEDERKNVNVKL